MAGAKAFAEVATAVAWPLAVVVLACLFRSTIKSLLSRVREIKATGVELLLHQLEEQGQLPVGGRAELHGLTSHDIWALESFAGCAIVISHDRWFLDRVATHILAFEGDSRVFWFDGNYSEYEEDKRKRLGVEASQPHRIRYRQMTR